MNRNNDKIYDDLVMKYCVSCSFCLFFVIFSGQNVY